MANTIKPKRSNTASKVPNTSELVSGELGVNMADKKVYINNGTAVVQVGAGVLSALGDVTITSPTNGQSLSYNGTAWVNATGAGTGTVTSVSVVSANGLAGTVATATTTPAITLTTSVTGLVKGNGTALSAATSGTDYSAGTSALGTGIVKSTTTTGALTIAVAGDFPTLNQNTTGSSASCTGNSATATTAGNVTGIVAISNGGTGAITAPLALTALGAYPATNPNGYTSNTGTVTGVTATSPVASSGGTAPVISMPDATSLVSGYLTNTDWATFNGKQAALGFTPYNSTNPAGYTSNTGTVTSVTGTAPVVSSGGATPAISMAAATALVNGYMTSTYASKLDGIAAGATNVTNTNQLTNGAGFITSSGTSASCSGNAATASSISGYNNPTTAPTGNTIVYRDINGDLSAREITLSSALISAVPTVLVSMYPATNQLVRTTPAAVASALSGQAMNIAGSSTSCTGNATTATTATNVSGGTVNSTTLNVAGNGSSADPYGTAAVTEPANANNYSYYGLTRQGNLGAGFGLTGTTGALGLGANSYWFGPASSGSAGVMSGAWVAFNSASFVANGTVSGTNITSGGNVTGSSTSCSGNAASASSVAASGITGQTGMWTSAARPGAYRLYRNDSNDPYNIQTTWSADVSGYWSLRGYYNDGYHAPCYVGYAGYSTTAGSAPANGGTSAACSGNSATATALSTASGSAPSYAARAWVNFNGQGTIAIRASGNVSSITDNGAGRYQVNFTTNMQDINYSIHTSTSGGVSGQFPGTPAVNSTINLTSRAPLVNNFTFYTCAWNNTAVGIDEPWLMVAVFR